MTNWAVIGTGDISRSIAADLRSVPSARRVAIASRDGDRARGFATEFGFERSFGSIDHLLADVDVEVVYIGTPHATHSDLAVAALAAGKHVLVEKPAGVDAADVRRIRDAARAAGRFAMEAMWMRFAPAYRSLLATARGGEIGEVSSVRASFGLPFGEPGSGRWTAERRSSTLLDQGIYPVTLALDVLGRPDRIESRIRERPDGVDLTVSATLHYDDGRFAQIAASMVDFIEPAAAISGRSGWIAVPGPFWASDRFAVHAGDIPTALFAPRPAVFPREGFGYVPMLAAVDAAIAAGDLEHPLHTLSDSVAIAELLDDIRSAAPAATPREVRT